ncbi:transposase family protein [Candidatus Poriferisodalis sp.]|uniref:transposase family protein n=1 Tax=Candidatus Poriferisodalis sp. TaxID=3101277 RepID=UPI003B0149D9
MAGDVVSVRLWLPQTEVVEVIVDAPGRLRVRVASSVSRPRCADCGARCGRVHDRREKRVRDLEVSGRPVTLVWDRRRMVCDGCGRRFLEDHPALEGRLTARLARRLVADAREMTVNTVARRHRVGWHTVMALVIAYGGLVGEHRRRRRCRRHQQPPPESCDAKPTASPTTPTSKPAASSPPNLTPPSPATQTPQKREGSTVR